MANIFGFRFVLLVSSLLLLVMAHSSFGSASEGALEEKTSEMLGQLTHHLKRMTRSTPSKEKKPPKKKPEMAKEQMPIDASPETQAMIEKYNGLAELVSRYQSAIGVMNKLPNTMVVLEKLPVDAVGKIVSNLGAILVSLEDQLPFLHSLLSILDNIMYFVVTSPLLDPVLSSLDELIGATT